jgi:hypothetical protein
MVKSTREIKIYFVSIPAHKFLHIKNYESDGYFDFWEKQDKVEGADCCTICNLLDGIKGKLDGDDTVMGEYSGQIMAYINEDEKTPEAYGVRLPSNYAGEIPQKMLMLNVPEAEYLVFEHGAFDYEQECETVGDKLSDAIKAFDFSDTGYEPDNSVGRIEYFFFDPSRFEKRVLPVKRK